MEQLQKKLLDTFTFEPLKNILINYQDNKQDLKTTFT